MTATVGRPPSHSAVEGCTWQFNPLHSSHMGGSWEQMIGVTHTDVSQTWNCETDT